MATAMLAKASASSKKSGNSSNSNNSSNANTTAASSTTASTSFPRASMGMSRNDGRNKVSELRPGPDYGKHANPAPKLLAVKRVRDT